MKAADDETGRGLDPSRGVASVTTKMSMKKRLKDLNNRSLRKTLCTRDSDQAFESLCVD